MQSHQPAGGRPQSTGSATTTRTGTSSVMVSCSWRAIANILGDRTVMITATSLGHDRTGVLLQTQSDWVELRLASERIPADVREIDISVGPSPALSIHVVGRRRILEIVGLMNALPIAQPVEINCPAEVNPTAVTIRFGSAGAWPEAYVPELIR